MQYIHRAILLSWWLFGPDWIVNPEMKILLIIYSPSCLQNCIVCFLLWNIWKYILRILSFFLEVNGLDSQCFYCFVVFRIPFFCVLEKTEELYNFGTTYDEKCFILGWIIPLANNLKVNRVQTCASVYILQILGVIVLLNINCKYNDTAK